MLVDRCWPAIRAVARELIERRYLSHADVRRIFDEAAP
jgi:predicted transcriptional regulator